MPSVTATRKVQCEMTGVENVNLSVRHIPMIDRWPAKRQREPLVPRCGTKLRGGPLGRGPSRWAGDHRQSSSRRTICPDGVDAVEKRLVKTGAQ